MRAQPAATLVGRIEHHPDQAAVAAADDKIEIRRLVGEDHGDDAEAARSADRQGIETCRAIAAGKYADLDDVDAERADARHGLAHGVRLHRQVADGRAGRPLPGDARDRFDDDRVRQGAESAARRLLEIDDVGAGGERDFRLGRAGDAGEHAGHVARSFSTVARCAATFSISQPQASRSRGPAVLSTAICR